ncbi:hypothetical protein GN956_G8698, partial [Arapaima gigas]
IATWNVATAEPTDDISSLLQLDSQKSADLYAIGLQEVNAAPLRIVTDFVLEDPWSRLLMTTLAPKGYVKVTSVRMQGLLLLIFSRLVHLPFVRNIETTYTRTGILGYWGNKGAVSTRLSFYGLSLCFLNCHLAAHMEYASERVDEFKYILDAQSFSMENTPRVLDHRLVFWFGDLNFRIADHDLNFTHTAINNKEFHQLWPKDQLTLMKKKEEFLQEFEEGPLNFRPTYKYDLFSDSYDTSSKKRKPAWTDRILWRVKPKTPILEGGVEDDGVGREEVVQEQQQDTNPLKVKQDLYTCCMDYSISDHKPVLSIFNLELRKQYKSPLVLLYPEGEWSADLDAMVTYSIQEPFISSTWDWIGLYKVGFRSTLDYITYTWVKDDEVFYSDKLIKVYVSKDEIPVLGGECVLCYYSNNMKSIVGISDPFQVQQSKAAVEEGLVPENISGLDKKLAS